jgi:tRNA A37 threonylcarbamoyladenosine modification protein TsaB
VGLAAAAGLGRGARVPVSGIGTTRCIALAAGRTGRVLVLQEAGHGRVSVAEHHVGAEGREQAVGPPGDASAGEALERARSVVASGGTLALRGEVPGAAALPATAQVAVTGPLAGVAARLAASAPDSLEPLEPAYGRAPSIRPSPPRGAGRAGDRA